MMHTNKAIMHTVPHASFTFRSFSKKETAITAMKECTGVQLFASDHSYQALNATTISIVKKWVLASYNQIDRIISNKSNKNIYEVISFNSCGRLFMDFDLCPTRVIECFVGNTSSWFIQFFNKITGCSIELNNNNYTIKSPNNDIISIRDPGLSEADENWADNCRVIFAAYKEIILFTLKQVGLDRGDLFLVETNDPLSKLSLHVLTRTIYNNVGENSIKIAWDFTIAFYKNIWTICNISNLHASVAIAMMNPSSVANSKFSHFPVDASIYTKDRCFRMPYQSKLGKNAILIPVDLSSLHHPLDFTVQMNIAGIPPKPSYTMKYKNEKEGLYSYINQKRIDCSKSQATLSDFFGMSVRVPSSTSTKSSDPWELLMEKQPVVLPGEIRSEKGVKYKRVDRDFEGFIPEGMTHMMEYRFLRPGQFVYCFECSCYSKSVVNKHNVKVTTYHPGDRSCCGVVLEQRGTDIGYHCYECDVSFFFISKGLSKRMKPHVYFKDPMDVREIKYGSLGTPRFLAIDAPPGTGKSRTLLDHILSPGNTDEWIIINNRISIGDEHCKYLGDEGCVVWQHTAEGSVDCNARVISICINSVHKLETLLGQIVEGTAKPRKIFIDEVKYCFSQITSLASGSLATRRYHTLIALLCSSPQVILSQYNIEESLLCDIEEQLATPIFEYGPIFDAMQQFSQHSKSAAREVSLRVGEISHHHTLDSHIRILRVLFNDKHFLSNKKVCFLNCKEGSKLIEHLLLHNSLAKDEEKINFFYHENSKGHIQELEKKYLHTPCAFLYAGSNFKVSHVTRDNAFAGICATSVLQGGVTLHERFQLVITKLSAIGTLDDVVQCISRQRRFPPIYVFIASAKTSYRDFSLFKDGVQSLLDSQCVNNPILRRISTLPRLNELYFASNGRSLIEEFFSKRNATLHSYETHAEFLTNEIPVLFPKLATTSFTPYEGLKASFSVLKTPSNLLSNAFPSKNNEAQVVHLRFQECEQFSFQKRHYFGREYPSPSVGKQWLDLLFDDVLLENAHLDLMVFLDSNKDVSAGYRVLKQIGFPFSAINYWLKENMQQRSQGTVCEETKFLPFIWPPPLCDMSKPEFESLDRMFLELLGSSAVIDLRTLYTSPTEKQQILCARKIAGKIGIGGVLIPTTPTLKKQYEKQGTTEWTYNKPHRTFSDCSYNYIEEAALKEFLSFVQTGRNLNQCQFVEDLERPADEWLNVSTCSTSPGSTQVTPGST